MRMFRSESFRRAVLPLTLVIGWLALGCPGQRPAVTAPPATGQEGSKKVSWRVSKSGLGFRLSDADEQEERRATLAKTTALSADETKRLLSRLPPIKQDPDDEKEFAFRDRSMPAPRAGNTVQEQFPPKVDLASPNQAKPGPLVVTRKLPTGPVDLAPHLSVSFSHPMVAVTSHDDLSKVPPPVVLSPVPEGKWRWIGSQTVLFEPTKRFPMATDYTVEVPAGTKSATGLSLATAEKWTFSTPPPKMLVHAPSGGSVKTDPIVFASFDQAIDQAAMLKSIKVTAGSTLVETRLATEGEIEEDASVRQLAHQAEPKRWIAFRPVKSLPTATSITVNVEKGAPSAEGPKRTEKDQRFGFATYGPLKVVRHECSYGMSCPPMAPWSVEFSNPLDTEAFKKELVRVDPTFPGMKVEANYNYLSISGRTKGRTKYKVTLSGSIVDTFGQRLGQDESFTIDVGTAEPFLFSEEQDMSIVDPAGGPKLPVFSVNRPELRVRLYSVRPEDWDTYLEWRRDWDYDRAKVLKEPPGKLVLNKIVKPRTAPDELVETPIELTPALNAQGFGQVLAIVEPTVPPKEPWMKQWVRAWLQVTKMGVDAFIDDDQVIGWATALETGAPVQGAEVLVFPGPGGATTGADGLARIALEPNVAGAMVLAKKGGDMVMLPERYYASRGASTIHRGSPSDYLRWFVFDDRKMYKPGEEAKLKGWLRKIGGGKSGDVAMLPDASTRTVTWSVRDPRGNEIGKGTAAVDASGGFDFSFKVPGNANLGHAYVSMNVDSPVYGASHSHAIQIQEFRRPEFEVNASASEGPHVVGEDAVVTLSAKYYAGGGLGDAPVEWRVTRSDAQFTPPNRSAYVFGEHSDWWWFARRGKNKRNENTSETWSAHTTPGGDHRLRVDFDALEPAYPMSLQLEATVTDVNRQAWTARSTLLVHPADVYVGLRLDRPFVKAGETLQVDSIVTDIEGKAVARNKVSIKAARIDYEQKSGEYEEKELDVVTCDLESGEQAVRCGLKTKDPGKYRITATTTDAHGRKTQTEMHVWVFGDSMKPDRDLKADSVQIVSDKEEYKAGDTAELLLVAPFAPAEGVLTLRRQGIVKVERFAMRSRTQTITVKLEDAHVPNLYARVDLVGAAERTNEAGDPDPSLPKRPAFASGTMQIKVPPTERTLSITATPRDKAVEPGGSTVVDVDVKDAQGKPRAGSELAVVVVDEAVLALSGYKLPDPLAVFYSPRSDGARQMIARERVMLAKPDSTRTNAQGYGGGGRGGGGLSALGGMHRYARAENKAAPPPAPTAAPVTMASAAKPMDAPKAGDKSEEKQASTPIAVRTDFNALAVFAPRVTTDARGHAQVAVKLPDSLTRYRVMAVAVSGQREFGSGESTVTARLPLMVRPSPPRFLNFGDKFELPLVVQNQTDKEMTVDVAGRAVNATLDAVGRRVVVPANDRVEVRLPAAALKPGTARFQIGVSSGKWSDASQLEMPVWTPATTEAFATYGVIDQGAIAQPVKMPSNVVTQFGGLEITTSSTQLQALTDAVLYLVRYPYECNEQLSSRVIAIAALRDVLSAFQAKGLPPPEALLATVKKDAELLRTRQLWDGGWGFWHSGKGDPFVTVHVAHALQRAKEKNFEINPDMLSRAQNYLHNIESHIPYWYGPEARRALVAYALYVRNRMGDADRARAKRLITESGGVEKMQMEPIGWILPVLSGDEGSQAELSAIRKHLANRVSETAGAAHFVTSYGDSEYLLLHSDRRADGVLLESIIGDQPQSDLIPKLVAGLLNHRKAGHWYNTQENAFVLLALDRYFNTYEKATPDFVAREWLGGRFAGERAFKGRSTDRYNLNIPIKLLAEVGQGDVILQKDGPGRLYFRIGMQYAPSDLRPPPVEHGFTVSRTYEGVDDPNDVKRDADGVWHVKAGAKVRVRIGMVAPARRYHVALVDPLPAGLEPMNPALAVTGSIAEDPKDQKEPYWWWKSTWYEHQNMRDERVEAFASLLWDGVYDYTYVARATTPGTFVAPPPKAEEMYAPETFGRGPGDKVIVE
jgi:hypothetical protein